MNFFKWIGKLIKPNSGFSSKSFFLVVVTIIGCILLVVPAVILMVEVLYNHTITTDLGGVAALFATAGLTKAWSEKYETRGGEFANGTKTETEEEE